MRVCVYKYLSIYTHTYMSCLSPAVLPKEEWDIRSEHSRALNIMGLVSFATVLGLALSKLGPKGKALLDFFHSLSDASMVITSWLIWSVASGRLGLPGPVAGEPLLVFVLLVAAVIVVYCVGGGRRVTGSFFLPFFKIGGGVRGLLAL